MEPKASIDVNLEVIFSRLLTFRSKEIEFVVPPTVSPYGSNRYLNNICRPVGTVSDHLTPNYTPSYANRTTSQSSEDGTPVINVVNKGWNMLQDVFTSSTSLNTDGSKKSNRSASLSVSSLGINHPSLNNLGAPNRLTSERRASTNSIYLTPSHSPAGRRSRSQSKGSIYMWTPPNKSPASSAPGSRKNSKPSICIEPAPEVVGNALLGGLNPSLYLDPEKSDKEETFPENHLGRLYFSIYYNSMSEALSVLIKKIRNLPKCTKESGITNKTYVKICLLPDERSQRRCSPSGDTFADLNPSFNENFVFQVSPQNLTPRTLRLLVFNIDVNRKHRVIGQTILELQDIDLNQGRLVRIVPIWSRSGDNLTADLEPYVKTLESDLPEVLISLCYNTSISRLTINLVEAKNLKSESGTQAPDTYMKLQLLHQAKEVKRKKTAIVKKEYNPQYQEAFNFKVDEDELAHTGLRITCMQHQTLLEKDRPLGMTVLGGFMFARGSGQEHWEDMTKNQKMHIQKWHKLTEADSKEKHKKLRAQDSI
eukprot:TCALIF_12468-PA protein Name:"Similar to SYT15 Synaptotagmin-15 (Homo sapiens)" AED:0.03 eAED:0.03 QI:0/0.9/0.81/1/0.9/0.81/11/60/536